MFYYAPPKSSIWGHRLGRMSAAQSRQRLAEFLATAVGHHEFQSASVTLGEDALSSAIGRKAGLTPPCQHLPVSREQADRAIDALVGAQGTRRNHPPHLHVLQAFSLSAWNIGGRLVPTESSLHIHYGTLPCISTFFQFDSNETFETIREALLNIGLCKLNPKHLRAVHKKHEA